MTRSLLCLAALLVASSSGAAPMLFTTLTTTLDRPLGATSTLRVHLDGAGIDTRFPWTIPLTADLDGDTLVGDHQTLGLNFWNFNRFLTNGMADGGLSLVLTSNGGEGRIWGKPSMFEDHDGSMGCCAQSESNFTPPNGLDMTGSHLTQLQLELVSLSFAGGNVAGTFALRIYGDDGQVPEPSSAGLLLFGVFMLVVHQTPHCRK